MSRRRRRRSIVVDLVEGAVAGALATWAMTALTTVMYEREDKRARRREDRARGGKTAYGVAVEKAARVAGKRLSDEQRQQYGQALHWALGIGAGALYGVLRPRSDLVSRAGGLLFGSAFFLAVDETLTPLLGLTKGPQAFPWQTHARGLLGHLAFGGVANTALAVVQRR